MDGLLGKSAHLQYNLKNIPRIEKADCFYLLFMQSKKQMLYYHSDN